MTTDLRQPAGTHYVYTQTRGGRAVVGWGATLEAAKQNARLKGGRPADMGYRVLVTR